MASSPDVAPVRESNLRIVQLHNEKKAAEEVVKKAEAGEAKEDAKKKLADIKDKHKAEKQTLESLITALGTGKKEPVEIPAGQASRSVCRDRESRPRGRSRSPRLRFDGALDKETPCKAEALTKECVDSMKGVAEELKKSFKKRRHRSRSRSGSDSEMEENDCPGLSKLLYTYNLQDIDVLQLPKHKVIMQALKQAKIDEKKGRLPLVAEDLSSRMIPVNDSEGEWSKDCDRMSMAQFSCLWWNQSIL